MKRTTVLFLCTGNSARSQMAEGFLRELAGDRFDAQSAGLAPVGLNPLAVQVMAEVGVDISSQESKSLKGFLRKNEAQYVVFVCDKAEKSCPEIWPFATATMCWPFPDPAAVQGDAEDCLEAFRRVRDQVRASIESWLATDPESSATAAHKSKTTTCEED
ncbi:arsenate reductase ArsC [Crateriforma conspicua]|nr:arsenate reductase ArsC [Crateriforma conspicua]